LVAGGSGERMGIGYPKQFILIAGKPVYIYTIQKFVESMPEASCTVVMNTSFLLHAGEDIAKFLPSVNINLIAGGETRFHSVKNALDNLPYVPKATVAIHDAVRPCISSALIRKVFYKCEGDKGIIPTLKISDSIRMHRANGRIEYPDRSLFSLVQTPQVFPLSLLKKAYEVNFRPEFTDDASVYEYAGFPTEEVQGESVNIKITFPEDLEIANFYLKKME